MNSGSTHKRGRAHATRRSVKVADWTARTLITTGGIGTIIAVGGVCLFLLWVVKDLFYSAEVNAAEARVAQPVDAVSPLAIGTDEYQVIGWSLGRDSVVRSFRIDDGATLFARPLEPDATATPAITSVSRSPDGKAFIAGRTDGTAILFAIAFETRYFEADEVSAGLRKLHVNGVGRHDDEGLAQRMENGQFRVQRMKLSVEPLLRLFDREPIASIHQQPGLDGLVVAAMSATGKVAMRRQTTTRDMMTFEDKTVWEEPVAIELKTGAEQPKFVVLSDLGTSLHVIWESGRDDRYSVRSGPAALAESVDLTAGSGARVTAVSLLLGGSTLIVGFDDGGIRGWFIRPVEEAEVDGAVMTLGHTFATMTGGAITSIGTSARERIFIIGTSEGRVRSYFMTSEKLLADVGVADGLPITAVALTPKSDALLAGGDHGVWGAPFDARHPEATFAALFSRVWYERYAEPEYSWQSSSGTDEFEPKLSLIPLIFGTIKATFYSMLLGVPLALLAAIYTSEFLNAKTRARIKPTIELMASLPSVVLGFLAAIVIAPVVETVVPTVLAAAITVPLFLLLGSYLWQWLPMHRSLRLEGLRLWSKSAAMAVGLGFAFLCGPLLESVLFAGDIKAWLDRQEGTGTGLGGWVFLMLPASAFVVAVVVSSRVNPWLRVRGSDWDRSELAKAHLAKFGGCCVAFFTVAVALGAAFHYVPALFSGEPWDLRGGVPFAGGDISPYATFDQRNALVVGFVMGFAIIPIIYTVAEDALSSVPEHLRAASLGAGATQWQTAMRVIIPTAMSGMFSAIMIGLGRAVGETMIVLMAAGNTPVMSMNVFSGFRTLSANIATELPEAVRDSTHYRTLFLAALVLFTMTFIINTAAEVVRLRFRRRAYSL